MNKYSNTNDYNNVSPFIFNYRNIDKFNKLNQQQLSYSTFTTNNLERSVKEDEDSSNNQRDPNYYEWSLYDIDSAHYDLFNHQTF